MVFRRSASGWTLVLIISVANTALPRSTTHKRSDSGHGDYGEGAVESYLMARELIEDLIYDGISPDPNGDEMMVLAHWRNQLTNDPDVSDSDLKSLLMGDPGIDSDGSDSRRSVDKRTIESNPGKRWTGGIVPFIYTNETSKKEQVEILRAMEYYQKYSCMRFERWENVDGVTTNQRLGLDHPGYLKFVSRSGCWARPGNLRWADGQDINCCWGGGGGTCIHELGHAFGVTHEHQSPNPDRNRFIRVNKQYITDDGQQWYVQRHPGNFITHGYDLNSVMHYSSTMYKKGPGGTYTILFPELTHGGSYYYHVREVSIEHKCQDQCKHFPTTCENDGYLTKVEGKCGCVCITGLDPATGCKNVYRHDPPGLVFPGGQYALPALKDGCPDGTFLTGSRKHYNSGRNEKSFTFTLKGEVNEDLVEENFCVSNAPENDFVWPEGNYCIYRKGGSCPKGFFTEGSVKYDDQPSDTSPNTATGELPDGEYGDDTKYQYCCKDTGFDDDYFYFPSRRPFALIKRRDQKCQKVRGMHLKVQTLTVGNSAVDDKTDALLEGDNPVYQVAKNNASYSTQYCVYKPAMIDCGGVYDLDSSNPEITLSSPDDVELECFWLFKAPPGERLSLDFTEFDIAGFTGACKDDLIVRYVRQGQPGRSFCGRTHDKTIISINNTLHIQLSTYSGYKSRFTAKVKLIQNEDLCYKREDRGMTYDGDINFTRDFEPCLPWHEMTHCEAHPFNTNIYNTLLTGNECRAPDQGAAFQPWCYTDKKFCKRNYCDVCLKGKLVDRYWTCDETKAKGECSNTSPYNCAKTCFDKAQPVKAKDVRCPTPPNIFDGTPSDAKASYAVGESVTYKCNYQVATTRERLCLSSGRWATLGTACSECPYGWHQNPDTKHCYRFFDTAMTYDKAVEKCEGWSAQLTTAKSKEEHDYVRSIISSNVWLGLTDDVEEGKWVWVDGTPLDYSKWSGGEPNYWNNEQDCALMTTRDNWDDGNCKSSYRVVCKRPVQEVQFCLDFWDKCRDMLLLKPTMCADFPDLAREQCQQTCKICNADNIPKCPVEPAGVNSKTDETRPEVPMGTTVSYSCIEGSKQEGGDMDRVCTESGALSGSPLECSAKITTTTTTTTPIPTTTSTTPKPTAESLGCEEGWVKNGGQCYKFVSSDMIFREAAVMCKKDEASIVSIKSKAENDFVASSTQGAIWLGATDARLEGKFTWMDGSALEFDNRLPTGSGTPNGDNEDCVEMGTHGKWNALSCYEIKRYGVCEKSGPTCPDNWISGPNGQQCYWYVEQMMTFREAATLCRRNGANLVSIGSMDENNFVTKSLKKAVWIGATDVREEGSYIWMDMTPVTFFNWNLPSSGDKVGDCLEMKKGGAWGEVSCGSDKRKVVCQKPGKACPSGWTLNPRNNKCYKKFESPSDHTMAIVECIIEGYNVLSINNAGEQSFVQSLKGPGNMWIGLDDTGDESMFRWADSSSLSYTNWDDGRPGGVGKETKDCVMMADDGKWSDVQCDNQLPYMCTRPLFIDPAQDFSFLGI